MALLSFQLRLVTHSLLPMFYLHVKVSTRFKRLISGPLTRLLRVAVHPSRIHGRGLFALRGFREDEMVIEYLGERIRNLVCEAREVRYRAAGVDCYMFRIDPDWVIDATYAGNAARFINHSCEVGLSIFV